MRLPGREIEDALDAVEQAVLHRLPASSHERHLDVHHHSGTEFSASRFLELGRGSASPSAALPSPGRGKLCGPDYRSLEEARSSIAGWIEEYNHDRPHRGIENRTPYQVFLAFRAVLTTEARRRRSRL